MRLPQLAVVDVLDAFPNFGFGAVLLPTGAQMAIVEPRHLRREPRRNMHTVGDVPDGDAIFALAGTQALPHGPGDFAVKRGNGIGAASDAQAQHRHAEILVLVPGILAAQVHQAIARKAEPFAQRTEMLFD